jgi:hypothetical protein
MAFDPTQPFEVVEDPQAQAGGAPRFDPSQAFEVVDDGQTSLIEGVGNSIKRGWTMSQMASEMEKPAPDPQRVAALQQEMQAAPPSDEYMTVMDDRRAPEESWTAFKSAPVKVLAELMGESFSAFAGQMIEKAPNRVAIGLGAGAAMGAPVAGIGAVPGGFIGAGAGFAEASGAASYSLEMAGGVLEALEEAGVPLDNPEALSQALQDPQRMQLAREFAQRKAVPIAIFDGASAVIGGRMFGGGKVTSAMQRLGQGMAETFTQAAMGASGEASGQLAQSGGITSGRAILAEGVAEIPTGLLEIGAGQLSQAGATANQPTATAPTAAPAAAPQPAPFTPPPAAETVVVEETFGEPTTAAAEPAATAAPAFDPSQGFEVVEEPSAPIVTEPPAAPRFQFDLADDTATAPEVDAEADVFSGVQQQQPSGPQPGIDVSTETDGGSTPPGSTVVEPEPPAPVTQPAPTASTLGERIRAAKGINDKRTVISQALETGEFASAIVEAAESGRPIPYVEGSLGYLKDTFYAQLPKSVNTDKISLKPIKPKTPEDAAAPFASTDTSRYVLNTVFFDAENKGVVSTDGRRLIFIPSKVSGKSKMVAARNFQKTEGGYYGGKKATGEKYQKGKPVDGNFPNWKQVVPEERKTDKVYNIDIDGARRSGAVLAGINSSLSRGAISGSEAAPALVTVGEARFNPQFIYDATTALAESGAKQVTARIRDEQSPLLLKGDNGAFAVIMPMRATGTVTADITSPSEATPDTPAKRSRRRIKNMTAQSGAIDLSIVEDLVEYGKTVYRAGMSFGKWAGQMVKEFGQGIASFLKQAFDRIVQAYKDSPYSDTTGAVGDVRPKAKPRQFEQKAAQAPGISEEARAQMGDDPYVPITLKGTAEEAKAWLAQNGVDAAERRILELNSDEITPTPLDFGIGLELTANLSATGQHSRAAAVVRTMSRRATSIGQTISVLAMLARLTPDGIVFYANQLIEQYINEMPEGIKARVRTAQTQVAEIEKGVAEDRKNVANTTIINGEHGGEKIATKVRRRIPDKGKSQGALTSVRSVLMSKATKAEAIKQIAEILQGAGISQSEAQSLANTIASRFYKVIEEARKGRAAALKPKSGKARISFDKLMSKLTEGKVSDEDFIGTLAVIAGVPAMTPEMRKQWQELARQYQEATDPDVKMVLAGRIFEEAHSILPADFWAKLRAISYLSMLFAPKTWIRNLGGNQIQFIANVGKDTVIDSAVDPLVSIFTGKRSTSGVYVGKRFGALLTPIWDVKKGYDWNKKQNPQASFSENMKAGIEHLRVLSKLTTQNKFDITDVKEVGRRMFSSKFMRAWEAGLSIALGGGDRGFWMAQFRTSMAQQEAAAKRNGEWTGQPTPEMVETAFAEAAYAIYQNPNFVSKGLNWVRKGLNWIFSAGRTTQFGVGTSLMAFTQVPGSIFLRAFVEWSPLGTINALYQSMGGVLYAKSGGRYGVKFDQRKFNNAFTQAILGTGVYATGYWLYAMGIVTASREEDEDLEAMRRTLGGGGYRINVSALKRILLSGNFFDRQETEEPDFIMTYDWAQPMAIAVAAGAEYAAQSERATREGLRKKLLGTNGTLAISLKAGAKSLEEQPLLSGLSSFAKTWGYSGLVEAVYGTIANIPAMFVPQLVRQASQLQDNTVRETRGERGMLQAFTKIASQTPFVQDTAPPRFDILGQAMERYQYGGNTLFNVLANPGMVSRVKEVPALSEVARLMNVTGETRQIPRLVERTADINGQSVELTNEQISAYQYYLGNYTMSMFNWRMASPRYARLPDTEKVKLLAQDLEDVNAATKSALFGHDVRRLTRRQRVMRANLVNSPLGQSMPPR